jgi:hypothetical protein
MSNDALDARRKDALYELRDVADRAVMLGVPQLDVEMMVLDVVQWRDRTTYGICLKAACDGDPIDDVIAFLVEKGYDSSVAREKVMAFRTPEGAKADLNLTEERQE